jgi:hypothetical protein
LASWYFGAPPLRMAAARVRMSSDLLIRGAILPPLPPWRALPGSHLPRQTGLRFSANAARPSSRSALASTTS